MLGNNMDAVAYHIMPQGLVQTATAGGRSASAHACSNSLKLRLNCEGTD